MIQAEKKQAYKETNKTNQPTPRARQFWRRAEEEWTTTHTREFLRRDELWWVSVFRVFVFRFPLKARLKKNHEEEAPHIY